MKTGTRSCAGRAARRAAAQPSPTRSLVGFSPGVAPHRIVLLAPFSRSRDLRGSRQHTRSALPLAPSRRSSASPASRPGSAWAYGPGLHARQKRAARHQRLVCLEALNVRCGAAAAHRRVGDPRCTGRQLPGARAVSTLTRASLRLALSSHPRDQQSDEEAGWERVGGLFAAHNPGTDPPLSGCKVVQRAENPLSVWWGWGGGRARSQSRSARCRSL